MQVPAIRTIPVAIAVVSLSFVGSTTLAQSEMAAEAPAILYTGAAVHDSAKSRPVRIVLERWSTEAERNQVVAAFASDASPKELATRFADMEAVGSFRTISGQANPIRFAREYTSTDGTRRLVLLTDDQIPFWAGASAPGTLDQAYTLIEVRFGGATDGEGKITHENARVNIGQGTVMIDDYDARAVGLIGVQRLGSNEMMGMGM